MENCDSLVLRDMYPSDMYLWKTLEKLVQHVRCNGLLILRLVDMGYFVLIWKNIASADTVPLSVPISYNESFLIGMCEPPKLFYLSCS